MKFGSDASGTPTSNQAIKFPKFDNLKWRTAAILKNQKFAIFPNHLTDFEEIWRGNAFWSYALFWVLKIYDFKNLIWQMFL